MHPFTPRCSPGHFADPCVEGEQAEGGSQRTRWGGVGLGCVLDDGVCSGSEIAQRALGLEEAECECKSWPRKHLLCGVVLWRWVTKRE